MRDLEDVLGDIQIVLRKAYGQTKSCLLSRNIDELEDLKSSISYSAPEMVMFWWQQAQEWIDGTCMGWDDKVRDEVLDIWTDRK